MAPAIELAAAGLPVDWFTALTVGVEGASLATCPQTRDFFLPEGKVPAAGTGLRLKNPTLTETLRRLANAGPRNFYEGDIAQHIAGDLATDGSAIDLEDLARYQPRLVEPANRDYRGTRLHAMPGLTGGPAYLAAMASLAEGIMPGREPTADAFIAYARALTEADTDRLAAFARAFPISRIANTVYPVQFAVPNAVQHQADHNAGMAHPTTPWPIALAQR